jgi:tRNA-2-methylthio-N6-dimethylallyladenosine synthase
MAARKNGDPGMTKKFYIETHGCQMNVHDSEKASFALLRAGYEAASEPAEADLVLLNTCMVRERAAHKVFTRIGELKRQRAAVSGQARGAIFGVMGCVAQAEAERVFERSRDVKLVIGTQAIGRLPELLAELEQGFARAIDVRLSKEADFFELGAGERRTEQIAYITIIEGCNKFCSYCIVPLTRGRERSRPPERILAEAQALAAEGYQEVHLLGQNVNSYGLSGRYRGNIGSNKGAVSSGELTFAQLLDLLASESGLPRIKFTTSYPRDFDQEVVRVIDAHPNLCEWIHLPAQAGSDRILRAMRRGYTRREYLEKVAVIKGAKKDLSITGDMIVGFPGETEEDFQQTLSLVAEVEYDGLYIFKYSPRPQTPAATYTDSVPDEIKTDRFLRLQELQNRIQKLRYARYLGREVEVLVQGLSARSKADCTGHTRCHKVVNFPCHSRYIGKIVKVRVEHIRPHSLYGELDSRLSS